MSCGLRQSVTVSGCVIVPTHAHPSGKLFPCGQSGVSDTSDGCGRFLRQKYICSIFLQKYQAVRNWSVIFMCHNLSEFQSKHNYVCCSRCVQIIQDQYHQAMMPTHHEIIIMSCQFRHVSLIWDVQVTSAAAACEVKDCRYFIFSTLSRMSLE
jgi:hypothetical protein